MLFVLVAGSGFGFGGRVVAVAVDHILLPLGAAAAAAPFADCSTRSFAHRHPPLIIDSLRWWCHLKLLFDSGSSLAGLNLAQRWPGWLEMGAGN